LSEIITPITYQLGVGGIGGFLVGYTLKKMVKIIAMILGLFSLTLIYLGYVGVISVHYDNLIEIISSVTPTITQAPELLTPIVSSLPFAGSFTAGFALGIKKG
jgi:uncharacterized membrane protein (Fun14 family)